jgi:hypothetical protein
MWGQIADRLQDVCHVEVAPFYGFHPTPLFQ